MLIRLHYCLKFIVVNFTIIMVAAYLDNACTCFILEYIIIIYIISNNHVENYKLNSNIKLCILRYQYKCIKLYR